jgi:hypothetical protein
MSSSTVWFSRIRADDVMKVKVHMIARLEKSGAIQELKVHAEFSRNITETI